MATALAQFWHSAGTALAQRWHSAGTALAQHIVYSHTYRCMRFSRLLCHRQRPCPHCPPLLSSYCRCATIILDEADRMLDMGFEPQLKALFGGLPSLRQT